MMSVSVLGVSTQNLCLSKKAAAGHNSTQPISPSFQGKQSLRQAVTADCVGRMNTKKGLFIPFNAFLATLFIGKKKRNIAKLSELAKENDIAIKPEDIDKLAELYGAEPEKVEKTIRKYRDASPDFVEEFKDIDDPMGKALGYIRDYKKSAYRHGDNKSLAKHVRLAIKYAPVLDVITGETDFGELRANARERIITTLGKELDETLPRIIADGRIGMATDYKALENLSHVYAKHPDTEITYEMIEANKKHSKKLGM